MTHSFSHFFKRQAFHTQMTCHLCHIYPKMDSSTLCQGCLSDIPLTGHTCQTSFEREQDQLAMPHTIAACDYQFPITDLIYAYKYEGKLSLLPILIDIFRTLPQPPRNTLLIPMPSSNARLKSRGYDHISLLSKKLANAWCLPLWLGVRRIGDAPQQKGLSRAKRLENIQGQFQLLKQPSVGHRLLIIDDVCTTGSTITALTTCLQPTGLDISAYVLAHKQGR